MGSLIYIVLILVILFFVKKFLNQFKITKVGSLLMVTGGVKTGKTTFAVATAQHEYVHNLRSVKFKNFFISFFNVFRKNKQQLLELPLFYSNIPIKWKYGYVQLTRELLTREHRFAYGSVILMSEASLVADSRMIKDNELNERLLLYFKLCGHAYTQVICDTQCLSDVHYSLKRCLSEYVYIHHLSRWLPFFLVAHVTENRYSDDKSTIVTSNDDAELHLRKVLLKKSVWKTFDSHCYSYLTDNKPLENEVIYLKNNDSLKAEKIVSFKEDRLK